MKYQEKLWDGEPKQNPFKVGDRVVVYERDRGIPFIEAWVRSVDDVGVRTDKGGSFHFRQCRLLEETKPDEIWIREEGKILIASSSPHGMGCSQDDWKKYREVLE